MSAATETKTLANSAVLRDSRTIGPTSWVLAILTFITVLAAAVGLAMGSAAYGLSADLAHRVTIQIIEANPDIRYAHTQAVIRKLKSLEGVESTQVVDDDTLNKLVAPWLGKDGIEAGLPYPSLIDVTLRAGTQLDVNALRNSVAGIAPNAHIEPDAQWLGPLEQLLSIMAWLAIAIIVLMMVAIAAAVALTAQAALNTHRTTIDILHLMGSSDAQISKLFQRRIALDALLSGAIGLAGGLIILIAIEALVATMGSEFLGLALLKYWAWGLLLLIPLLSSGLANLAARQTIMRALRQML